MHSPVIGDAEVVASAISITGFSKAIRKPTPEMGSSTDEVLASVGYSADEITDMRKKGAI
jgi:crotonobetainyl-CoA:carnitine CoA-transferase CaiB-like acyl-CoA transferase